MSQENQTTNEPLLEKDDCTPSDDREMTTQEIKNDAVDLDKKYQDDESNILSDKVDDIVCFEIFMHSFLVIFLQQIINCCEVFVL